MHEHVGKEDILFSLKARDDDLAVVRTVTNSLGRRPRRLEHDLFKSLEVCLLLEGDDDTFAAPDVLAGWDGESPA